MRNRKNVVTCVLVASLFLVVSVARYVQAQCTSCGILIPATTQPCQGKSIAPNCTRCEDGWGFTNNGGTASGFDYSGSESRHRSVRAIFRVYRSDLTKTSVAMLSVDAVKEIASVFSGRRPRRTLGPNTGTISTASNIVLGS